MEEMLLCFFLLTINLFVQSTCEMTFTFGCYPDVQLHLLQSCSRGAKGCYVADVDKT